MAKKRRSSIVALALAHEMAAAVEAGDDHRDALVTAAVAVGQWLADQGHAGRWDRIDPGAVLRAMPLPDPVQASDFLLTMAGLVGFAAFNEYLDPPAARRVLLGIEAIAEHPVVARFAGQTAAALVPGAEWEARPTRPAA